MFHRVSFHIDSMMPVFLRSLYNCIVLRSRRLNLSRVVGSDRERYLQSGQDYPTHNPSLLCTRQQKWMKMSNMQFRFINRVWLKLAVYKQLLGKG